MITAKEISLCKIKLKQQTKSKEKLNKNKFEMFCSQFGFSKKETKPSSKLSSPPLKLSSSNLFQRQSS